MVRVVEAPEEYTFQEHLARQRQTERLFLAGGITGTRDWQQEVVAGLEDLDMVVFNPRRANFPIDDPEASFAQIRWEFEHFQKSSMILFWFPPETLCPIALYELGRWTYSPGWKPPMLFVGTDPEYARRQDIEIQTSLARPGTFIYDDLGELVQSVRNVWGDDEPAA